MDEPNFSIYDIKILNDEEADDFPRRGWGHGTYELTEEHLKALHEGKNLCWFGGEYTTTLRLERKK